MTGQPLNTGAQIKYGPETIQPDITAYECALLQTLLKWVEVNRHHPCTKEAIEEAYPANVLRHIKFVE